MVEYRNLKKTGPLQKLDTYVRLFLMPGSHMELKTKCIRNNLNPVYNDEFKFVVCIY